MTFKTTVMKADGDKSEVHEFDTKEEAVKVAKEKSVEVEFSMVAVHEGSEFVTHFEDGEEVD